MRLPGKVALITGGSSGIGEAIAKCFAAEGAGVALIGRREKPLAEVVAAIEQSHGQALGLPTDVTVETDVKEAVEKTADHFGRIDALVNGAGSVFSAGFLHEMSDERDDRRLFDRAFPSLPRGHPHHAQPGRRLDHQHLDDWRPQGICGQPGARLCGGQGWGQHLDQDDRHPVCEPGHSGERDLSGRH